jgi:hypothetical protein
MCRWYNLSTAPWTASFISSNPIESTALYPNALLRISLSSIPNPSHLEIMLNSKAIDLTAGFPADWAGSHDRRWVEIPIEAGIPGGEIRVKVSLTKEGRKAKEGQGGKMLTSFEVLEYGTADRFNATHGFIGAFPTYSMTGTVTLRPVSCSVKLHDSADQVDQRGLLDEEGDLSE